MGTIDRVSLVTPDGALSVHDYSFSQVCELIRALSKKDQEIFWDGKEAVYTERTSTFAPAGTRLKYVGPR